MSKPRVLIFIVAYNAEKTIHDVLSRIPADLDRYDTEILIIDDASRDGTFEKVIEYEETEKLPFSLTVLFNSVNQGYGGNQKIGFHYAIEKGFDAVALLHGDGQYAPEKLPELVEPVVRGKADAVFGSRMMIPGGALKGGMPIYKFVGNRILSRFQNRILGASLTEFHSGYRVYSTQALKRIPFDLNTRDFHFDTEIIIQLHFGGFRILEVPIPTYYGDEICHVNGLRYAFDVVRTTLVARLQELSLLYQRKFDVFPPGAETAHYKAKFGFDSSHTAALEAVEQGSNVLDVGCASGFLGKALKEKGCRVSGVDAVPLQDRSGIDEFHHCDLDQDPLPVPLEGFDTVLLLDVIEHLKDPERFVARLAEAAKFSQNIRILVTTGNIGFFVVRLLHFFGVFNYGKRGILDLSHTRLFTFTTLRRLFEESGFEVEEMRGIPAPFPLALGDNRLSRTLLWLNKALIRVSRGVFAYQIFAQTKPLPSLELLLRSAVKSSQVRREKVLSRTAATAKLIRS